MNLIYTDGMTQQKVFQDANGELGKNKISYNG